MMLNLLDLTGRLPRDVCVGVGVGEILPEDWTSVPEMFSRKILCYSEADTIESTNEVQLLRLRLDQIFH